MPTYQYQCKNCGHELEDFQSIIEPPLSRCPNCGMESLVRIMGGGAGLIFKGTGFYLTDYRKTPSTGPGKNDESKKKESPAKKEGSGSIPTGGGTPETK